MEQTFLISNTYFLYIVTFLSALIISFILTPFFRYTAVKFNILDRPVTSVKTHKVSTPYLGGLAVWAGWSVSLIIIRLITDFPTGTLNNLRSVMAGSFMLLVLGLCDDIKKGGLGFKFKFLIQILAAVIVTVIFDIRINFIENYFLSVAVSILWIIGLSNAFNIMDIMDGLSCGIAAIAAFFFLIIALPSEMIYVNFCAAALIGGCLGFIPFNLSKNKKIFMGDTGSLSIGFILSTVAMGTSYTEINTAGIFAPLLILAVPVYETAFVSIIRMLKGKNPFLGSKDHFPLRLEKMGFSRKQILIFIYFLCLVLGTSAYIVVKGSVFGSYIIFSLVIVFFILFSIKLARVEITE